MGDWTFVWRIQLAVGHRPASALCANSTLGRIAERTSSFEGVVETRIKL